jgi:hypothetical protein
MHQFSVISSVYFVIFSAFFITFLFPDNAVSINLPVLFTLARVKMPRLLLGMVRSVYIFLFHDMFTLPLWLVSTDFGTWSYQCSLSNFPLISLHLSNHNWAHALPCLFMYYPFANIGLLSRQIDDRSEFAACFFFFLFLIDCCYYCYLEQWWIIDF